jgi:AcrR family transcriptional regulator
MSNHCDKDTTTKETILNAALKLITTEGLEKVTLRKIASCAEVNLALINYYFGSKDKLINESLKLLLADFKEHFHILDDMSIRPKQRLKKFLKQYAASIFNYPELVKELLGKGDLSFDSQMEYVMYMKTLGVNKVERTIKEITGEEDNDKLRVMMMHIHSAVFFPMLMAQRARVPSPVPQAVSLDQQIDLLFENYFAKYPE